MNISYICRSYPCNNKIYQLPLHGYIFYIMKLLFDVTEELFDNRKPTDSREYVSAMVNGTLEFPYTVPGSTLMLCVNFKQICNIVHMHFINIVKYVLSTANKSLQ